MLIEKLAEAYAEAPVFDDYPDFRPFCSPPALLKLGIFNGRYFDDSPEDVVGLEIAQKNLFFEKASFSRAEWQAKGWITTDDPLGWVQWYLRFWRGRRLPGVDPWQVKRWRNFKVRHGGMLRHWGRGDPNRCLKHRQAHLHWACWPYPDLGSPEQILDTGSSDLPDWIKNECGLF